MNAPPAGAGISGNYPVPPSQRIMAPVVKLEAGLASRSAVVTISSGRPGRPAEFRALCRSASLQALEMSVKNGPAEMALTRTFGPYSRASETVIAFRAALAPE